MAVIWRNALAIVETSAGDDLDANLSRAEDAIADAARAGSRLVVLPENFAFLGADPRAKLAIAERAGDGPVQCWLAETAAAHGVWLVGGTIPLRTRDPGRVRAACLVYDDSGACRVRYDKMHLFDAQVAAGEGYRESDTYEAGTAPAWVDTPLGRLGLAVCYDVRFPELFRVLVDAGCELLALPSAFTVPTGRAHWEPLVRARAIENGVWLLAAAQTGEHPGGRETWGHSVIVDPWGALVAEAAGPGPVCADYDPEAVAVARGRIPALAHRRRELGS